jgi:hypothetical protein
MKEAEVAANAQNFRFAMSLYDAASYANLPTLIFKKNLKKK